MTGTFHLFGRSRLPAIYSPERVLRVKREILDDVRAGVVPKNIKSFSELHDYVDANCYGGLCEGAIRYRPVDGPHGFVNPVNRLQDEIDRWIKAGGVRNGQIGPMLNAADYWDTGAPAKPHPAYKGSEHVNYAWWLEHYAPAEVRAAERQRQLEEQAKRYGAPAPTAAERRQMRDEEADMGRKMRAASRRGLLGWGALMDGVSPETKAAQRAKALKTHPRNRGTLRAARACPVCGSWNTITESYIDHRTGKRVTGVTACDDCGAS